MRWQLLLFCWLLPALAMADNWPAWRGPTGQGVCAETDLPLRWTNTENVRWKAPLPAPGNSTPIVWGQKIFLTQAVSEGRRRMTLCLDRTNGKVVWERAVEYAEKEPTHRDNSYCSASPVTDGDRVIVSHGSAGVFCYDLEGNELWHRNLGKFHHIWGNASSPVIHGDLCLLNCGPGARSFLLTVDKRTGKTKWQANVPSGREGGDSKTWTGSWSTPVIFKEVCDDGDRDVVLLSVPKLLRAFEPTSGKELWSCAGLGLLVYTSPIVADGVAVAMSGYMGPPIAVKVGGSGDVTESQRLWRKDRGPQRIGSGVIRDGKLYVLNDSGIAECLNVKTGARVWRERLGAKSWSSMVLSGDRIYTADLDGTVCVVRAAPKFELLARNELGERTRASLAVSDGELFLRTYKHLWCIGKTSAE